MGAPRSQLAPGNMCRAHDENGLASAPTLPGHGSTNPSQEEQDAMSNTTVRPEREAYLDLEDGLHTAFEFAAILADMLDEKLELGRAERIADGAFRFIISREELEHISFLSNQTQNAARKVKDEFYSITRCRRADLEPVAKAATEAAPVATSSPELLGIAASLIDAMDRDQLAEIAAKIEKIARRRAKAREARS